MRASFVTFIVAVSLVLLQPVSAGIITQWDFESDISNDPAVGSGSFWTEGAAVITSTTGNDRLNVKTYGTNDGIGWAVSTAGYENINVSMNIIRNLGLSYGKDWTWSYFDGTSWIDGPDFRIDPVDNVGEIETLDLTGLAGVDDNSDFKFRVLVTTDFNYASGVTVGFDNVTISGTPIPEPATMTIIGLGTMLMGLRRKK